MLGFKQAINEAMADLTSVEKFHTKQLMTGEHGGQRNDTFFRKIYLRNFS
jgi:hypothetical protein